MNFIKNRFLPVLLFGIILLTPPGGSCLLRAQESGHQGVLPITRAYESLHSDSRFQEYLRGHKIKSVVAFIKDAVKDTPQDERLIYSRNQYQQILRYPDFIVSLKYYYDSKGIFRIEELRLYQGADISRTLFFRQGKIASEKSWDKVTFEHRGRVYILYGPFAGERSLINKSFFLIREKYVRNARTAYIYIDKLDDRTIEVKKIENSITTMTKISVGEDNRVEFKYKDFEEPFYLEIIKFEPNEQETIGQIINTAAAENQQNPVNESKTPEGNFLMVCRLELPDFIREKIGLDKYVQTESPSIASEVN